MDTRIAPRALVVALTFGLVFAVLAAASPAAAQTKFDVAAKALQKKAMEEDYLTTEFAKAQEKLDKAIAQCGADKCSVPTRAQLRRDLGVVLIGGQIDKEKGIASFVEALKLDPNLQLDPDLKTKDLEHAFADAKKRAAGGGGEQPGGDFTHTPVAEQQIRTAIPIYAEYSGEQPIVRAIARYKGFGMTEWKALDLKKMGEKGWGGLVPCADVQQGATQYYLQGFDANNDPIATAGDRNHPYKVNVKREKVAEAPHLPGEPAPTQCADTGDCPPNFPGCKKPAVAADPTENASGKDGGEFCEEDTECKSNKCDANKCTDPEKKSRYRKVWVGVFGAMDFSFLPSTDNACKLRPTSDPESPQSPVNDQNYYCVNSNGDDYPYRILNATDTNPRAAENANLVTERSNRVSGGTALGNVRVMASIDYAINMNFLLGARLGYAFLSYPGKAAGDDGKSFPPIHAELRGTYLIGKDAMTLKFAPYAFFGAGISTWDASVKVLVEETGGAKKDVTAWHIGGPAFVALGGGVRLALSDRMAFMGGLRVNFAFGNAFAPSVGPELGLVFGF